MNSMKYIKSNAKKLKILSIGEAAYLAGLLDGEGSFIIAKIKHPTRVNYTPVISVANTNSVMIDLCHSYGGNCQSQDQTTKWKPVYRWIWTLSMMRHYLPNIIPYMKIRRKQAKMLLHATTYCAGTGYGQDKEKLVYYRYELQKLNKVGRAHD